MNKRLLYLAILLVLTSVLYLPSLKNNFNNWDDNAYITSNPQIILSKHNVYKSFTEGESHRMYAPLTALSHSIVYSIYGLNPKPYILINLIVHLLNILLLYLFLSLLVKNPYVPLIATALFALHPMQVESVAYAAGRRDVLYTFFYFLCLIFYLQATDGKIKNKIKYGLSLVFALLALLSKGQALTIPLTLILLSLFRGEKWNSKAFWINKIPYLGLSVIVAYKVFAAPQYAAGGFTSMAYIDFKVPFLYRIICACYAFVRYVVLLLCPYKLSLVHPYPIADEVYYVPKVFYAYFIVFLVFIFLFSRFAIKKKIWWFGLAFFSVNIVMLLQIIPNSYGIMNDHYVYFAGIGIFLIIASSVSSKFLSKKILIMLYVFFALYFVTLGYLSYQRIHDFRDSITVWTDVIKKYPGCSVAYNNRGAAYNDLGMNDDAISDISRAIKIKPNYTEALFNRANLYQSRGAHYLAIADYNKAIRSRPNYVEAYNNRGNSYLAIGFYDEAFADFTKALEIMPGFARAYNNRGLVYQAQGQYDKALEDYHHAIELMPDYVKALRNRGLTFQTMGLYRKAIRDFSVIIKYNPDDADAYYNLGVNYDNLQSFDTALQNYNQAIELKKNYIEPINNRGIIFINNKYYNKAIADFNKVIELKPDYAEAYNNRGYAYTMLGQYKNAIRDLTKAIELSPGNPYAYNNRGHAKFNQGDINGAMEDYNMSIKINDVNAYVYNNRGELYLQLKKYNEALTDLNKCIQLDSTINDAYLTKGLVYSEVNETGKACHEFRKARDLGNDKANEYINRFCK